MLVIIRFRIALFPFPVQTPKIKIYETVTLLALYGYET